MFQLGSDQRAGCFFARPHAPSRALLGPGGGRQAPSRSNRG